MTDGPQAHEAPRYSLQYLTDLEQSASGELSSLSSCEAAEAFRIKYLGKKGLLRAVLRDLSNYTIEERKAFGAAANSLHAALEQGLTDYFAQAQSAVSAPTAFFDPTLPGFQLGNGSIHPLTQIRMQICSILMSMGFDVAYGPEVETDYYNFTALNFPPHHPARDMQDTFLISPEVVLRTHTSPVQIRLMEKQQPPIRSIMPGRVYRNEEISSRSYCMFHQVEGLYIDTNVSFADLKGTLLGFAQRFFSKNTKLKIRPSFFPFTEPSVEIDVECFLCKGSGCSVCKQSGWLEVLGAGMVHPTVLKNGGIDPERYTGFAFGIGVERISLLKFGIDDIRLLFENDSRFLAQF